MTICGSVWWGIGASCLKLILALHVAIAANLVPRLPPPTRNECTKSVNHMKSLFVHSFPVSLVMRLGQTGLMSQLGAHAGRQLTSRATGQLCVPSRGQVAWPPGGRHSGDLMLHVQL